MGHDEYMRAALDEAEHCINAREVPAAAVLVVDGEVVHAEQTHVRREDSLAAHAELLTLLESPCEDARDATIYTTLEPCLMCYGAMLNVGIDTLVYGMDAPDGAFTKHNMQPDFDVVPHVLEEETVELVNDFREQHDYAADYVKELLAPYESQMTLFGEDTDG